MSNTPDHDNAPPNDTPFGAAEFPFSEWEQRAERWSWFRVWSFFAAAGGVLGGMWQGYLPTLVGAPALLVFVWSLLQHERIVATIKRHRADLQLLEEDQRRSSERRGNSRPTPIDADHVFPLERGDPLHCHHHVPSTRIDPGTFDDLSVFEGELTLFGLLDQSSTCFGNWRWQRLLSEPLLDAVEIGKRQSAVEAFGEARLRHRLKRILLPCRKLLLTPMPRELDEAPYLQQSALALLATVMGLVVPVALVLTIFVSIRFAAVIPLALVLNMALIGRHLKSTREARRRLERWSSLVPILRRLIGEVAPLPWQGEVLLSLQSAFERAPLATLQRQLLPLRLADLGALGEILNIFTLWELQFLPRAERHLLSDRDALEQLLSAVAELEVLMAQAFWIDQEGFCRPQLSEERRELHATGAAHPLLPHRDAVSNPVSLDSRHQVLLLTGSNMAGKSTYLRAVASNQLLALTGSWVCADSWEGGVLALQSNMHVRDSLASRKSYFQAEVERVGGILAESVRHPNTLVIMDELFRGTNAEERLVIARALIRYLRDTGVLLLVATHDTRLSELATVEHEAGVVCGHFQERFVDGVMRFDYLYQEGPVRSRNAISVLEAAGYDSRIIDESREELGRENAQG